MWWMLLGGGSNGKSLFFGTIAHVLGGYAKSLPLSAVIASHNRGGTGEDIAGLANVRFCYVPETIEEAKLDDARIKAMTGQDTVAVRHLYGKWFDLTLALKLVMSANRPPAVKDSTHGFWRRVNVIPFDRQFVAGQDLDPNLKETLQAEASGILNWLIRGYVDYVTEGLATPESVKKATARYARDSDHLRDFIYECCEVSPAGTLEHLVVESPAATLYRAYRWWTTSRHLPQKDTLSSTMFGLRLTEQFDKERTNKGPKYVGIRVRPDVERRLPKEFIPL
jgi:putative DNA primase/helicase